MTCNIYDMQYGFNQLKLQSIIIICLAYKFSYFYLNKSKLDKCIDLRKIYLRNVYVCNDSGSKSGSTDPMCLSQGYEGTHA